ncbi:hypothetical protein E2C01_045128 [Portunus trituberculatus]|uniref:Uncharacterized protein n=1 Tax=Portunus trituberculatus TaxID=210409 RepID=A0A5B7FUW7_PORTR|nr:hypothetical protein [Portunus trituberculatus]
MGEEGEGEGCVRGYGGVYEGKTKARMEESASEEMEILADEGKVYGFDRRPTEQQNGVRQRGGGAGGSVSPRAVRWLGGGTQNQGRARRSARMPIMNHIDFHVSSEISTRGSESVHLHVPEMRRKKRSGRMVVAAVKDGKKG